MSSAAASSASGVSAELTADLTAAYRSLYKCMLAADTAHLRTLLSVSSTLTHMTGVVQTRDEWMDAIDAGQMRYSAATEKAIRVQPGTTADTAVLVGQHLCTASIYGARGTWPLQLTIDYAKQADGSWIATELVASTF